MAGSSEFSYFGAHGAETVAHCITEFVYWIKSESSLNKVPGGKI